MAYVHMFNCIFLNEIICIQRSYDATLANQISSGYVNYS